MYENIKGVVYFFIFVIGKLFKVCVYVFYKFCEIEVY